MNLSNHYLLKSSLCFYLNSLVICMYLFSCAATDLWKLTRVDCMQGFSLPTLLLEDAPETHGVACISAGKLGGGLNTSSPVSTKSSCHLIEFCHSLLSEAFTYQVISATILTSHHQHLTETQVWAIYRQAFG